MFYLTSGTQLQHMGATMERTERPLVEPPLPCSDPTPHIAHIYNSVNFRHACEGVPERRVAGHRHIIPLTDTDIMTITSVLRMEADSYRKAGAGMNVVSLTDLINRIERAALES